MMVSMPAISPLHKLPDSAFAAGTKARKNRWMEGPQKAGEKVAKETARQDRPHVLVVEQVTLLRQGSLHERIFSH
jgi:hypothetical protein